MEDSEKKNSNVKTAITIIVVMVIVVGTGMFLFNRVTTDAIYNTKKTSANAQGEAMKMQAGNAWLIRNREGEAKEVIYTFSNGVQTVEPSEVEPLDLFPRARARAKDYNGEIHVTVDGKVAMTLHDGLFCSYINLDAERVTTKEMDITDCTLAKKPWE